MPVLVSVRYRSLSCKGEGYLRVHKVQNSLQNKFKVLNSSKSIYRSLILGEFWTIFCTEICNFTVCWADTKDTKEMKVVAGWYQLRSYVRKRYRLFDCSVGYVVKLCIRLIVSIHEFSNVKFTVVWTFK